jgi:outer membrane biosynthesis protein TonB
MMTVLHTRFLIPVRTLVAAALCFALLASACEKKVVKTTPTVLVPSIETQLQPPATPQTAPEAAATPEPENPPSVTPETEEAEKPKPKPHKPVARKPTTPEPLKPEPVQAEQPKPAEPSASVQISADVPNAAVQSETQKTVQLLRDSEAKLASLARSLNESEQAMQRQARDYIAQSNQAVRSGDYERAYNLAMKANLLANELAK